MKKRFEVVLKADSGNIHKIECVGYSKIDVSWQIFKALHKLNPKGSTQLKINLWDSTQLLSIDEIPGDTVIQELVPTVHT